LFMPELPRTGSGKISKRSLREPNLSDTREMKTQGRH
jgi:acyl-coenzyme A synthetase/AMP-(fatty) acid ligase